MQGQLKKALSGFYYVQCEGNLYQTRARGNFRKRKVKPLVGDFVEFESTSLTDGYLLEIFPRKNELLRPPVANVDQVIVVSSLVEPDFSYHLLDRFLVSLEQKKIEPVIYLSKVDLLMDNTLLEEIKEIYHSVGYQVIIGDENGLDQVKALLKNRLMVLAGQSGAGKSTLLNKLVPGLDLETKEISEALNRGKHTTRHIELIDVANGLVADTPGFSSIDFFDLEVSDLPKMFPEFMILNDACRFRECSHTHEPDCAVKEALAEGNIAQIRYDNYLLFLQELKNQRPSYQKKKK